MRQPSVCVTGMVMVGCLGVSAISLQAEGAESNEVKDGRALDAAVGQREKVTGVAAHAKAGSVIVLMGSIPIYLDGMVAWSEKELDKTVTATGRLEAEPHTEAEMVDQDGHPKQTGSGTRYMLKGWTYSVTGTQDTPSPTAGDPAHKH